MHLSTLSAIISSLLAFATTMLPIAIIGALVIAVIVEHSLVRSVQPQRLLLAKRGELLLAEPGLPHALRREISMMLDNAFPADCICAAFMLPLVPVMVFMSQPRVEARRKMLEGLDEDILHRFIDLRVLHRAIAFANHPVLHPVFEALVDASLRVAKKVRRNRLPVEMKRDRDTVLLAIEEKEQEFRERMPWHKVPALVAD